MLPISAIAETTDPVVREPVAVTEWARSHISKEIPQITRSSGEEIPQITRSSGEEIPQITRSSGEEIPQARRDHIG